ncbi:hypothetical protein KQ941_02935 [Paenibacillus xylanexedens]|uniref:hypothetical protein n=1 Tax=Paenibacillus xylanexedens TaxID=528191 RepID=UPI001F2D747F|nr:hypothetical protein [Paenibacillus xylanexedens]MCF7753384.1 hypothetical protein [Paenibacillus xylanexedens]
MAVVAKRFGKGVLSGTLQNLYTAPANATAMVKAITICNTANNSVIVTFRFADVSIISAHPIAANNTVTIPFIDQVIHAGESIQGSCGQVSAISYYISGKEVT